jgi:hypothetical protein
MYDSYYTNDINRQNIREQQIYGEIDNNQIIDKHIIDIGG